MRSATVLAIGGLFLPLVLWRPAAHAAAAQEPQPIVRSNVNTVLVDLVVRDRKGRALRGLEPSEVEVLEDGVPQKVLSFREVRSTGAARLDLEPTVQGSGSKSIQVNRQIRLVSLIFERLGNQNRAIARQAAREFLNADLGSNVYYAVFYVDRTFLPVLSYTNDKPAILRAIDLATSSEKTSMANDTRILQRQTAAPPSDASAQTPPAPGDYTDLLTAMQKFNERLDRDMFGRISIFSLWGVIAELSRLPGRKSVLYFSEGVVLPGSLLPQYHAMIGAANRANVAVHTIDARGLITTSDILQSNQLLSQAVAGSVATREADPVGGAQVAEQMLAGDYALDSIHGAGQMNLTDLAERTGGTAISNTNDFCGPMRDLSEEFNTYYEITYSPTQLEYDGRFRSLTVKVSRSGASVQSRSGYFALPAVAGDVVFPYEVPLLHALGRTPPPQDVKFRAGALQFGERDGRRQVSVVFDLPLRSITFTPDEKSGRSRSHISVLSLIKDESGRVVEKLSRDVPMSHPAESVQGFRGGRFIATRVVHLPPGRYLIESVAADQEATQFGTLRSVLVVAPAATGPRISEMTLVRRFDKPPDSPEPGDPLYLQDRRVIPTLDDKVIAGPGSQAAIFLVVYPEQGVSDPPQMTIQIRRNGAILNQGTPDLPQPNASGACPYLLNFGISGLEPAEYEVRAIVSQSGKLASSSFFVTIEGNGQAP